MKFVCDRCQTRYSISDEKVRGKVLKIRCKTCSNIVVVRETSQAAAQAVVNAPAATTPPPPPGTGAAPPAAIDWWVAIKGEQKGPMKAAAVEQLYRAGQISAKSYAWHDGLANWVRLRELPAFAHLAAEGASAPPVPASAPPPPPADAASPDAQVVDLRQARAQRQPQQPAASAVDPFAAVASNPLAADAPKESTRVFIMNAGLANRGRKHKTYAVVAVACVAGLVGLGYADWSGYIQIPGLHSALSFAAESAGVEPPKRRQFLAAWDEAEGDAALRCKMAGIDCPEPVAQKRRPGRRRPTDPAGVGDLDLAGAFGGVEGTDSTLGRGSVDSSGAAMIGDPLGSNAAEAAKIASVFGNEKKRALTPTANIEAPSVSSGSGLEGEQIFKVVKDNQAAIKACVESAAKQGSSVPGKQYLIVTIPPNGVVQMARFKDAVTNTTPVGECIVKRAKKWKFPPFAGEAFDVEIPLILSTSL